MGDRRHPSRCGLRRAIGANAVAVVTGWHDRAELASHEPDLLLDDLSDPAPLLACWAYALPAKPQAAEKDSSIPAFRARVIVVLAANRSRLDIERKVTTMNSRSSLYALAAGLAVLLMTGADWTRFRGPNGTGTSTDKDIPVAWTEKDILWKTPLPGTGHSSPIVLKGKIFLLTATKKERMLVCLDADSGKELWSKAAPGGTGRTHPKSSLASSTPCSDGEQVYCVFWDGKRVELFAYDLAGKFVWKSDLGPFTSQHGPGFSPVVHNGKVFVNNDQDGSAVLLAFDAKDGKLAWEVTRPAFRACYSTPILHEQGATGTELIVTSTAGISGYNPADGTELWKYSWSFPGMAPAHRWFIRHLRWPGDLRGWRRLRGPGHDRGQARRQRRRDPDPPRLGKGSRHAVRPHGAGHKGYLYTINDDGVASCYESKSGKQVWSQVLREMVSSSPVLIDGKVYAITEKGNVIVFEATPAGYKRLAKNSLGELVYATPAVANGRLYIRGGTHLFCIGKAAATEK